MANLRYTLVCFLAYALLSTDVTGAPAIRPPGSATPGTILAFSTFPDIRVAADPFGDISWGLPAALLLGKEEDYALYINKLRFYQVKGETPDLPDLATMRITLERVLLDTADKRRQYYAGQGQTLSNEQHARARRILRSIYRRISTAHRANLADALSGLYEALIAGDSEGYARQLSEIEAYLLRNKIVAGAAKIMPVKAMQHHLASIINGGIGEYLNAPIQSDSLDCSAVPKLPASARNKRIALDAGHFGGEGVTDSREYKGYREGKATFIVAHLVKAYLTACGGMKDSNVMLTRYDLYSLPGNAGVSIRNNALMDYRTELLALLQPDLALSIHTDGGAQRTSIFTPSTRTQYYFYRGRGFHGASARSAERSLVLAEALRQGLEERLSPLAHTASFAHIYRPLDSVIAQGRSKVFQNLFADDVPLAIVEGFSHAPQGMVELLLEPDAQTESMRLFGQRYAFHPLLRHYAEGVARGLSIFFVQKQ